MAVVTDFMQSLMSVPYKMPETETDDDNDDENNTSTTSPCKSTSTNTLGQVRAYPEEDDLLFDEDGDGDSTNDDLTPFHNKTSLWKNTGRANNIGRAKKQRKLEI
jgi:hypothetical protein